MKIEHIKVLKLNKFPYRYSFKQSGSSYVMFSDNLSSVTFSGKETDNRFSTQVTDISLNEGITQLNDYACNNLRQLTAISFCKSLTSFGDNCFSECVNILQFTFPYNVVNVGNNCFKNCNRLSLLCYDAFELDANTYEEILLNSIGSNLLDGVTNVKSIIFPKSIDTLSKTDSNALLGSNVNSITFLGINGTNLLNLNSTKCLGLNKNCVIYSADKKQYVYTASTNTVIENSKYDIYNSKLYDPVAGKMRLGKLFHFNEQCIKWCIDYNTRTAATKKEKFPSENCPIIIFYLDLLTSLKSRQFYDNVIANTSFAKNIKDNMHCYMFVLSRNADFNHTDSKNIYFRSLISEYDCEKTDFSFVTVFLKYNSKCKILDVTTTDLSEVLDILQNAANELGFSSFDYSQFEIKLEDPYEEIIPTGTENTNLGTPWWYSNGSVTDIGYWS